MLWKWCQQDKGKKQVFVVNTLCMAMNKTTLNASYNLTVSDSIQLPGKMTLNHTGNEQLVNRHQCCTQLSLPQQCFLTVWLDWLLSIDYSCIAFCLFFFSIFWIYYSITKYTLIISDHHKFMILRNLLEQTGSLYYSFCGGVHGEKLLCKTRL